MPKQISLPVIQPASGSLPSFAAVLKSHDSELTRTATKILQVNLGKFCNQACQHCHVGAGPKRTEIMSAAVATRILKLLTQSADIGTVDLTGGAPELNGQFRGLAMRARELGMAVIDRCNLTVLFEQGQEDLPEFLAGNEIQIVASLPCYTKRNVDEQRGQGVFQKSIEALQILNAVGYGHDPRLQLDLMFNPLGPSLPPPQAALEADYKRRLADDFGIVFNHLFTLTNMPIERFDAYLARTGRAEQYGRLLIENFNPATVPGLMCRSLVSVSWDGRLYDCDFNQMIDLPLRGGSKTIWDLQSFNLRGDLPIATGTHCFGCTAGAGSSCGGSLNTL